ncbi:hypothetical protein JOD65_003111 [Nocardioides cavernae]|nr:hypothetical protein [Nocardioides cavernae]
MRSPHDVLLLRSAPPNNAAGTPESRPTHDFTHRGDNAVAPQQHPHLKHHRTTHERRHL